MQLFMEGNRGIADILEACQGRPRRVFTGVLENIECKRRLAQVFILETQAVHSGAVGDTHHFEVRGRGVLPKGVAAPC